MNISMKLNGMLVDSLVVFFRLHGPFEVSFYEITFGRGPLREEGDKSSRPFPQANHTQKYTRKYHKWVD